MAVLKPIRMRRGAIPLAAGLLFALAASGAPTESEVKAAYLFNFARYVTWPAGAFASAADPLRICVVGDEGFREVLAETVAGKQVGDRPVIAESRGSAAEGGDCHVLFLPSGRAGQVSGLSGRSVFTVSDVEGFAAGGGIANFVVVDSKVRFEINAKAAERAGLQVSSRLLRLARVVE